MPIEPQALRITWATFKASSRGAMATIAEPDPLSVAPYAPAERAASITVSRPGTRSRRKGTWSTSSSAAVRSGPSPVASPWTRAAPNDAALAAMRCGTVDGSIARARIVSTGKSGTASTRVSRGDTPSWRTSRSPSRRATASVAPPKTAGATLSGCPSTSAATPTMVRSSRPSSKRALAATAPATVAAAEEPSPRAMGIVELARTAIPRGVSCPAYAHALWNPTRMRSSLGEISSAESVPSRENCAVSLAGSSSTATESHRSTAIPTQSKPAPRFDVEAGTRTATAVMREPRPFHALAACARGGARRVWRPRPRHRSGNNARAPGNAPHVRRPRIDGTRS